MDTRKILLGEKKHKVSINETNFVDLNIVSDQRLLPSDGTSVTIDAYQQYYNEKNKSQKYRLDFAITPVCTNVLFNVITEPVYKEGSDDCVVFLDNGPSASVTDRNFVTYRNYKQLSALYVNRGVMIADTGFSHPDIGPVTYHCGYDIFNNHMLRKKDFSVVNIVKNGELGHHTFNTISDYMRTKDGEIVKQSVPRINSDRKFNKDFTKMHLYMYDNVYSYTEAIQENLFERNGWIGFLNTTTIPVINYKYTDTDSAGREVTREISLNKCMNNNKAWEQYDMYPDRELYSFVPKFNKYRGRSERNWDYVITYPASSTTECGVVQDQDKDVNGLDCKIKNPDAIDFNFISNEWNNIMFRTYVRNNLREGDMVEFSFIKGNTVTKSAKPIRVVGNGEDAEREFSVKLYEIYSDIIDVNDNGTIRNRDEVLKEYDGIRIRKVVMGTPCQYYVRIFKPLPVKIDCEMNRLGFAQNAYSDPVAQLLVNDTIDTTELVDNLGRQVSELFLTIVKRNKGYVDWYENNRFRGEDIEYSHCFGEVTSGFDLPADEECKDYNVHRIHSVPTSYSYMSGNRVTPSPEHLEREITIDNESFMGDIVEFSPYNLNETVLEDVYHRFNTAQRETTNTHYSGFTYTEITGDDYDFSGGFSSQEKPFSEKNINIIPEGYYYKPHYRVKLREFSDTVMQGYFKPVTYSVEGERIAKNWDITTTKDSNFELGDTVHYYESGVCKKGKVIGMTDNGDGTITVGIKFDIAASLNGSNPLFRVVGDVPEGYYDMNDGSGRYMYRPLKKAEEISQDSDLYDSYFTNGAHYFHKNIMFYLKRQDPTGEYGIGLEPNDVTSIFILNNEAKDISYADYEDTEASDRLC